jgi:hypothetical protein
MVQQKMKRSTGILRIETLDARLSPVVPSSLTPAELGWLAGLSTLSSVWFCLLSLSSVSQRAQIIQDQPRHRQQDKQKRSPIAIQGYTTRLLSASSPPATQSTTAIITTPCPCRLSRPLFSLSLSTLSPNYSSTPATTTTTTTARRCLCHLVHADFDVANGLSYFHHQLRAAFIHSFILTHHPRAGHLTQPLSPPQHLPYHTHTRLTRPAIHHPRTSHKLPRSDITHSQHT